MSQRIPLLAGIVLAVSVYFLAGTTAGRELPLGVWRPYILAGLVTALVVLVFRQAVQHRRWKRLHRIRMELLRRFARNRFTFSADGSSENRESRDLLAQISEAFAGVPEVIQALQQLEESLVQQAGRQLLIEQHSTILFKRLCRELNVDTAAALEIG